MASNAQLLWTQLPQGALKLQLLAEIATLVQLSSQEMQQLWSPLNAHPRPAPSSPSRAAQTVPFVRRSRTMRTQPASRADHAARILLGNLSLWSDLSGEDHNLLCALPHPHGDLFTWLEGQLLEHGPVTWTVLQEGMADPAMADLGQRLMVETSDAPDASAEAQQELRDLLNRMLVEQIKELETLAIEAVATDPAALARYRELHARRVVLEKPQSGTIIEG
jgi:DNA primase